MTYQLPPSLTQYGADLEAAIRRDLQPRRRKRLTALRLRRAHLPIALMVVAVVVAVVLSMNGGTGGPFVTAAYAQMTGGAGGPFISTARCVSCRTPTSSTSVASFSWTDSNLTMKVRFTERRGRRITVQDRVWTAKRTGVLKPTLVTVTHSGGPARHFSYFGYENIHHTAWAVQGGTTTERNGNPVRITLIAPIFHGSLTFVQIQTARTNLTFKITRAGPWQTISSR